MHAIKQLQQRAHWTWSGGRQLIARRSMIVSGLVGVMNAIAAFNEANESYERSLPLEQRLGRTGRIRYR